MTDKEKWTEPKATKESKGKKLWETVQPPPLAETKNQAFTAQPCPNGAESEEDAERLSWLKPFEKIADAIYGVLGDSLQLQTKRRIYLNIAQFIQKKADSSLALCLGATYILCQEENTKLLRENPPNPQAQELAELAKQHILTIKVHYEQVDVHTNYLCQTEIYYLSDGKPAVSRIQEQSSWDQLPDEVREQVLRTGAKKVSFKLFPQQG